MTIEKDTIRELVKRMLKDGKSQQDIEDAFKDALKAKMIDVDDYYNAMVVIYR